MPRSSLVNTLGWVVATCLAVVLGFLSRRIHGQGWTNRLPRRDKTDRLFDVDSEGRARLALEDDPYEVGAVRLSAPAESRPASLEGLAPESHDRAVIAEATVRLIVSDITETAAQIERLAREAGGFVLTLELALERSLPFGQAVLAVPAERVTAVIERIRSLPVVRTVIGSSYRERDVTGEVLDLEARLSAARRSEERYLALLERAEHVHDVLRIEEELRRIRSEIERLEGQQRWLADRRRMARVTIAFQGAETSVWRRVVAAFGEGWQAGLQELVALARFGGRWLGVAAPAALLFTVAGWLLRRIVSPMRTGSALFDGEHQDGVLQRR
ncbi:DUF4349 domain-containing protein [Thermomicrobium sp. 4228-Ro]|uniref:DUF4349 domain-containing protein n=1 Tax=Thermomicrobium sp. 4228-Ro TaxID=2993937 RepID=UPI00224920F9|nr:DUF4349 domain-containing protein [Thermomicrobium sp. 4228-Ro]MCX2726421.1 DUF4349 domain-containing protein [Thermomicrobium sp. 4228-Ro]